MYPSYLRLYKNGQLSQRVKEVFGLLESCSLCPRKCLINRKKNRIGFCKTGLNASIFSYMPHLGEEPPISGKKGSGTIFFSGCNMACVYCQNYRFSQSTAGKIMEPEEIAQVMLILQGSGCHNINLVTPTHVVPQILKSLCLAIPKGLNLPLVYNTSGYELPQTIKLLEGIIDIFLADMRYAEGAAAMRYSNAGDYPKYNKAAIKQMHRQVGVAKINKYGLIERGLIIRHLVLPNNISGTAKIMRFIAEQISPKTYISLMSQYTPYYKASGFPELARRISEEEYSRAQTEMSDCGLENGWVQESRGLPRLAGVNIKPMNSVDR